MSETIHRSPPSLSRRLALALPVAVACHVGVGAAATSLVMSVSTGMRLGRGMLGGLPPLWADLLLLAVLGLIVGWLVGRDRPVERALPRWARRHLDPGLHLAVGSWMVVFVAWAWTPLSVTWTLSGSWVVMLGLLHVGAWTLFVRALWDARLRPTSGMAGWWAVVRGQNAMWPWPAERRLSPDAALRCAFAFALVLWTAPVWSLDGLLLAVVWTGGCLTATQVRATRLRREREALEDRWYFEEPETEPLRVQPAA